MNNLCSISIISFLVLLLCTLYSVYLKVGRSDHHICVIINVFFQYYFKIDQRDIKNIIWWTNLILGKDRVIKCVYKKYPYQCMVSNNRTSTFNNIKQPLVSSVVY